MKKKIELPIWGIVGDDNLSELAALISELRVEIKDIEQELVKKEEEMDVINGRLNIYINNSLGINDFDNNKDFLVINEKNEAFVYPQELLVEKDIQEISNLPEPEVKYQISKKQSEKIIKYMDDYAEISFEYEDLMDECDELLDYHDQLWDDIHQSLSDSKFLKVYNKESVEDENMETFDSKKHMLFVVKDESESWSFKYIRKKDEKKFYKQIEENKKEEV
jgi:hypothetical protein